MESDTNYILRTAQLFFVIQKLKSSYFLFAIAFLLCQLSRHIMIELRPLSIYREDRGCHYLDVAVWLVVVLWKDRH